MLEKDGLAPSTRLPGRNLTARTRGLTCEEMMLLAIYRRAWRDARQTANYGLSVEALYFLWINWPEVAARA